MTIINENDTNVYKYCVLYYHYKEYVIQSKE